MSTLALHQPPGELLPAEDTLSLMLKTSTRIAQSGLAGKNASPESVLAIALTGRELGIPFMTAVRGIHVIEGKPSPSAAMIAGLIYRDHGDDAMRIVESTNERCVIKYRRKGWPEGEYATVEVTMADAKAQGWDLVTKWKDGKKSTYPKDTWQKFPKAMLRSRAITIVGQDGFPDSVLGLYTPDELDADVPDDDQLKLEHRLSFTEPAPAPPDSAEDEETIEASFEEVEPEPEPDEPEDMPDPAPVEEKAETLSRLQEEIDAIMQREAPNPETGEVMTWQETIQRMAQTNEPFEVVECFGLLTAMAQNDEDYNVAVAECRADLLRLLEHAPTQVELDRVIEALNTPELKEHSIKNKALVTAYKKTLTRLQELTDAAVARAQANGDPF